MANGKEGALLIHPALAAEHPQLIGAIQNGVSRNVPRIEAYHSEWSDHTRQLRLSSNHFGKRVVIPGVFSGRSLESNLEWVAETGYALTQHHAYADEKDYTQVVVATPDIELRGDKTTTGANNKAIEFTELLNARYTMDKLVSLGHIKGLGIIDPHNEEFLLQKSKELGIDITAYTALAEAAAYIKKNRLFPKNVVGVSPDRGAIWRNLVFSLHASEPNNTFQMGACIEKKRRGDKIEIVGIHGKENLKGKVAVIVDDMQASGGTFGEAATKCIEYGATGIIGVMTHAKDVDAAPDKIAAIMKGLPVEDKLLIFANTTPYVNRLQQRNIPGLRVVDIAPVFTRAVNHMLAPANPRNKFAVQKDTFDLVTRDEAQKWLYRMNPQLHDQMNGNA